MSKVMGDRIRITKVGVLKGEKRENVVKAVFCDMVSFPELTRHGLSYWWSPLNLSIARLLLVKLPNNKKDKQSYEQLLYSPTPIQKYTLSNKGRAM